MTQNNFKTKQTKNPPKFYMKLYIETTGLGLNPSAYHLASHTTHLMLVCAGTETAYPSSSQSLQASEYH